MILLDHIELVNRVEFFVHGARVSILDLSVTGKRLAIMLLKPATICSLTTHKSGVLYSPLSTMF